MTTSFRMQRVTCRSRSEVHPGYSAHRPLPIKATLLDKCQAASGCGMLDWAFAAVACDSAALDKQAETVPARGHVLGVFAEDNSRSISAARGKSHIRSRVASKVDISHFINDRVAARALATLGHRKHAIDYVRQRTDGPRAAQITLTQHYFLSSGKTKTVINHIYIERGSVVHAGMEYAFQQNIHCLCRKVK